MEYYKKVLAVSLLGFTLSGCVYFREIGAGYFIGDIDGRGNYIARDGYHGEVVVPFKVSKFIYDQHIIYGLVVEPNYPPPGNDPEYYNGYFVINTMTDEVQLEMEIDELKEYLLSESIGFILEN